MSTKIPILCVIGPTASGKTSKAIEQAKLRSGEIISVDSRQVYRGLNIGTEKAPLEERNGIPHYLIDIRDARESYSASDFVTDASRIIKEIHARGKFPILAGGTFFYFDALLHGLPAEVPKNLALRAKLEESTNEELFASIRSADARRAAELDPKNRRRLIRALEIIDALGAVPERRAQGVERFVPEWIILNPPARELRARIDARLKDAFEKGLIDEVRRTQKYVGNERLNELGLEYRIVGEYLRGERPNESLLPALSAKLWQYARRQKAWLRKLTGT